MNKEKVFLVVVAVAVLAACAPRPTIQDIQARQPDCRKAHEQIKMLDEEMVSTTQRAISGVKSVVPSLAVVSLLSEQYSTNYHIAIGRYNKILDAKIKEIKVTCNI